MSEITKDTTMGEIAKNHPKAAELLAKNGMPCVGCPMAMMESLENGAKRHGIDLDKLLKELNDAVKEEK